MSESQHRPPHAGPAGDRAHQGDVRAAASPSFFDQPVEPVLPTPSAQDVAQAREAYVWQRLVEIQARHRRSMNKLAMRLGKRTADVQALRARMELRRRSLRAAEQANGEIHALPPPPRGLGYDSHSRALGIVGLVLILLICMTADYLVDRGALQVLLLPLRLTQLLALFVAVVQTASAHTVGRLLRRQKEAVDPDGLRHERTKMRILIGFVAATVLGLAVLRTLMGSLLLGLVMLGVGAAAAVVAVTASYLHASTRLDALRATDRRMQRVGRATTRIGRRLLRAQTREAVAANDLRAGAAAVVSQVELVYAHQRVHLNGSEPRWVDEMRRRARGEGLPTDGTSR